MTADRRLSVALHALQHLHGARGPVTSEALGTLLRTHPVVVRRIFVGLRGSGLVRATRGHGGGWSLARPLDRVTLLDVYESLRIVPRFALGRPTPRSRCVLEHAADRSLFVASSEAQALLLERLGATTVLSLLPVTQPKQEA